MTARSVADEACDAIERAFASAEAMAYLGEDVTMAEHQLQAAALAVAAGCADSLVVAALLHDVGHLIGSDAPHEEVGARWLSQWFGPDVTEPVRLHVAAKRYLVATEPDYAASLSSASVHTLQLQGGPMLSEQVRQFEVLAFAQDAVTLRRLDEAAKDASRLAPGLRTHLNVLRAVTFAPTG